MYLLRITQLLLTNQTIHTMPIYLRHFQTGSCKWLGWYHSPWKDHQRFLIFGYVVTELTRALPHLLCVQFSYRKWETNQDQMIRRLKYQAVAIGGSFPLPYLFLPKDSTVDVSYFGFYIENWKLNNVKLWFWVKIPNIP